jgi:hypothetical protein
LARASLSALIVWTASAAVAGPGRRVGHVALELEGGRLAPTLRSMNRKRTVPTETASPCARRCSEMRSAPTRVPLVLPRSRSSAPRSSIAISACRPDTDASRICTELPGRRPSVRPPARMAMISPRRSPLSKRSA